MYESLSLPAPAGDLSAASRMARGRVALPTVEVCRGLAGLFGALSDPTRAGIVCCLLSEELCTRDLAAILGISEPAVSQHLRLLRQLSLVRTRREGKRVLYSLDDRHVADLIALSLDHLDHSNGFSRAATKKTEPANPAMPTQENDKRSESDL